MQEGAEIRLTDGRGRVAEASITEAHKKKCRVLLTSVVQVPESATKTCIAISPIKNASRFEWFLEKATEIGITEIVPLLCTHTEKTHLKMERLQNILVSAMLQSQQYHLPVLREPVTFSQLIANDNSPYKFIAHCRPDGRKLPLQEFHYPQPGSSTLLIGPEGDFSIDEIAAAEASNYNPVSLGNTRLRTETAGVVAAVLMIAGKEN